MDRPRLIVILGPTAGGKSELAAALAESLPRGGQVISADSMQVYSELDAGTAKPSPALRRRAPHHLIDIVEPTQRFTVADWLERAETLIGQVLDQGQWPIVVGGTNLYIKALLEGMFEGPEGDPALRQELAQLPGPELHARLASIDPPSARRIHPNDRKKLIRALEVHQLTGRPISAWQTQWEEADRHREAAPARRYRHDPILIGLDWPTPNLNHRINLRVKAMFDPARAREQDGIDHWPEESLPDEARRLSAADRLGPQAREALGYKQVLEHLAGQATLEEAFERTKILTRRFAKSQRTWLRRFQGVAWLPAAEAPLPTLQSQCLNLISAACRR